MSVTTLEPETAKEPSNILDRVDSVLAGEELKPAARALLLLRLCQQTQVLRPEAFERYLAQLEEQERWLPAEYRKEYYGLHSDGKESGKKPGAFVRGVLEEIEAACGDAASDPEAARAALVAAEERLRGRWYWPFGRRPAWIALVGAWAELDRKEAIARLHRIPDRAREVMLSLWQRETPLTPEEWELACLSSGAGTWSAARAVVELLDHEDTKLDLTPELAEAVGKQIEGQVFEPTTSDEPERITEDERKALGRYFRLVRMVLECQPQTAHRLMQSLLDKVVTTWRFSDCWTGRFSALRPLIDVWASLSALRPEGIEYLRKKMPGELRDFALAHWYAALPAEASRVREAMAQLLEDASDRDAALGWFLVELVRNDLGEEAHRLVTVDEVARPHADRVRRALICEAPELAARLVDPGELGTHPISRFLLQPSPKERAGHLRSVTANGAQPLPDYLWKQPSIWSAFEDSEPTEPGLRAYAATEGKDDLMALFKKDEAPERRFPVYLRLNGYGRYTHDEVDPRLLEALIAWDDEHPEEVDSVLRSSWKKFEPDTTVLFTDVLRQVAFKRCRTVFAAKPTALTGHFLNWIRMRLVSGQAEQNMGDGTIRTLQLPQAALFTWGLVAAQGVAQLSPGRCDRIIELGLEQYTPDEEMTREAAKLYASDKGLLHLRPPVKLEGSQETAWQLGVVDTSVRHIMLGLLVGAVAGRE